MAELDDIIAAAQAKVGAQPDGDDAPSPARPASASLRALGSFRQNDQDLVSFLKAKLGENNVAVRLNKEQNEVESIRVREKGEWTEMKPKSSRADFWRNIAKSSLAGLAGPAGMAYSAKKLYDAVAPNGPGDIAAMAGDVVEGTGGLGMNYTLGMLTPGGIAAPNIDLVGSAVRQGISAALPGKESITTDERAKSALINMGAGLAGDALGGLGNAGMRVVRKAISPTYRLASQVAKEAGSEAVDTATGRTVRDYIEEAPTLEKFAKDKTGETLTLTPGQRTGSKTALMMERTAAQMPETMEDMRGAQAKRRQVYDKIVDKVIESVAARPEQLGKIEVSSNVAKAVNSKLSGMSKALSAEVDPYFRKAESLIDTAPTSNTVRVLQEEIDRLGTGAGSKGAETLRRSLASLVDEQGNPTAKFKQLRAEQSYWSGARKNKGTIIDGMPDANARRIASAVSEAIERDFDELAEAGGGEGVEALRAGRRIYSEGKAAQRAVGTESINQILRLGRGDGVEEIAGKVFAMEPSQVRGLVKIMKEASPETLQDLRALRIKTLFENAGKGGEAAFGADLGSETSFNKLLTSLNKKGEGARLNALFEGDEKAIYDMRNAINLAKRLALGPGIEGSDTAPKSWMAAAMRNAAKSRGTTITGLIEDVAVGRLFGTDAMARGISKPGGADAFTDLARSLLPENKATGDAFRRQIAAAIAKWESYALKRDDSMPQSKEQNDTAPKNRIAVDPEAHQITPTNMQPPMGSEPGSFR